MERPALFGSGFLRRALLSAALVGALAPLQGCPLWMAGALLEDIFPDTVPLLDTNWAKEEFAVISPDTPREDVLEVKASYDDDDERDTNELDDLDEDENLGDVVIELKAGIYLLENPVTLSGAKSVKIKGAGAHKTRLVLNTETRNSLKIVGAKSVKISGLTVAPFSADGITIEDCPAVEVTDVTFAGSLFGLRLRSSTAEIGSSVFAGCQSGVYARQSEVTLREVSFVRCQNALKGMRSGFKISDSYIYDNRTVIDGSVDRRTELSGNLIFGDKQVLGWEGRPGLGAQNLVHFRFLGKELGEETNRELTTIDGFPDGVVLPPEFNVVAVHLAQERQRRRGQANPAGQLEDLRLARADEMAVACQEALRRNEVERAQHLAKVSLSYLGELPLERASDAVVAISGLGNP